MLLTNLARDVSHQELGVGEETTSVTLQVPAGLPFDKKHLLLRDNVLSTSGSITVGVRFNSDATAVYSRQELVGTGGSDTAARTTGATSYELHSAGATANEFTGGQAVVVDAFSTRSFKAICSLGGNADGVVRIDAGSWQLAGKPAITSVTFIAIGGGSFDVGSLFTVSVVDEYYAIPGAEDTKTADGVFTLSTFPKIDGDVKIIANLRSDASADEDTVESDLNDDSTDANYERQYLRGDGAVTSAAAGTDRDSGVCAGDTATADVFSAFIGSLFNVAGETDDPHWLTLSGHHADSGDSQVQVVSGRRNNIERLTKYQLAPVTGTNFVTDSMFSAYFPPKTVIAYKKLAVAAASVTLAIPQGFRDFILKVYARTDEAAATSGLDVQANSDATAANYDGQRLDGDGSTVTAAAKANDRTLYEIPGASATANVFGGGETTVFEYTKTDRFKQFLSIAGAAEDVVEIDSMIWRGTAAVTQLVLTVASGDNFLADSIFVIEGIGKDRLGWEDNHGVYEAIVEVDTTGDESFSAAIDDLVADGQLQTINTNIGRNFPSTLTGQSTVGKMDLSLTNYQGDFSFYESTSPYFGLIEQGTFTRMRCETPVARTLWFGIVHDITAAIAQNQAKSAMIPARGPFHEFSAEDIRIDPLANVRTDQGITEILDQAGFSATRRDLGVGKGTMPYFVIPPKTKPLRALRQIQASEGSATIRESEEGKVVFEEEGFRLGIAGQTPQAVFADTPGAGELKLRAVELINNPNQNIFNDVRRKFRDFSPGSLAVLWTAPVDQTIPPGESRTFTAEIPNQTTQAISQDIFAIDPAAGWVTPVVGTDITASASAGGGTDMNGDIVVGAVVKTSNAMEIPVQNNGAVETFLSLLQGRGTPLEATDWITVGDIDQDSIDDHGQRTFPNPDAIWVENAEEAHEANLIDLANYKGPTPIIRLEYEADSDHYRMAAALRLTLSDRITVRESTYYGINEDFFIERIFRAVSPRTEVDGVRVDRMIIAYDLSPAAGFSDFFIWGFSEWGISTRATRS